MKNPTRVRREKGKRLEKPLKGFGKSTQAFFDLMPDIVVIVDAKGRTLAINHRAEELTGFKREELLGKIFLETKSLTEESKAIMKKNLARRMMGISLAPYEVEVLTKNGEKVWAEVNAAKIDYEGKPADLVILRDLTERKRMEGLRRQADLLEKTFDSMTDALFILDAGLPVPTILDCNRVASTIFGYEKPEMLGKTTRFLHASGESLGKFHSLLYSAVEENRLPLHLPEHQMKRKDGSTFPSEHIVTQLLDDGGKRIGWVSIVRDITERKKMEDILRKSEAKYRFLYEESPAFSLIIGIDGGLKDVSKSLLKELGYSRNDVIGKKVLEFVVPEQREKAAAQLEKDFKGEKTTEVEFDVYAKDGSIHTILFSPGSVLLKEENQPTSVLLTGTDITGRKRMEEALRGSEERYRNLAESISDVFFVMDGDLRYTYWNKASESLTGISAKDAIGKTIFEIFPDREDTRRAIALYREVLKTQQPKTLVHEYQLRHGIFFFEINAYPTKEGVSVFVRDVTERSLAQEKLRVAHEQLLDIVEFLPDATFVIDRDRKVVAWNRAMEGLTGIRKEDIVGKGDYAYGAALYGEPRPILIDLLFQRDAELEKKYDFVVGRISENTLYAQAYVPKVYGGKGAYLWGTASLLYDSKGNPSGAIESIRDITDRKRIEEELKKHSEHLEELVRERTQELRGSEEKFRRICSASLDAIYITSREGEMLDMNPAGVAMFGYESFEELEKVPVVDLYVDPDDRRRFIELMDKGPVRGFETRFKRKDGGIIHAIINAYPLKDEKGRATKFQGAIIDITERKQMEERLRESEERFRGFAERSFDAIIAIDSGGRINYASPAVIWVTGYTPEEVMAKPFQNLLSEEDVLKVTQNFAKLATGEIVKAQQFRIRRKEGSQAYVEANASPIIKGGDVVGIQVIVRDISERYRLMEMKDRFISAVTHELRTPLTSVKGYLDFALAGELGAVPKEIESSLQVVKRNTDRLLSLTNDLLDYRRLESGRFQLNLEPLNFRKVIEHSVEEIQPFIKEKKQSLHLEVPDKPLLVQGDHVRLSQVLMNLLSNANKYTPEGGDATLRVQEKEGAIQVQVSDTGIGIREEDLHRVFDPFAAIKKPTYIKGTGLGLSVTKGLVEAHGGRIWAESPGEGKGATFIFTLPRQNVS